MRFLGTSLPGVFRVEIERRTDERGSFARTFCAREFAEAGLPPGFVQWSTSFNARAGTLRGMHWQRAPQAEAKLVRCTRGAIHDVVADIRPDSPAFGRHEAFTLRGDGDLMLFIPAGLAHGFLTLEDSTEVLYAMDIPFVPGHAAGFRWDDPAFAISWPAPPALVSAQDTAWASFRP
jgi:dTDP-4-dehydrorhamnose 3,5-epimerase